MGFLKQLLVTLLVLAIAGAVWLKLDPTPGAYLLASDLSLPTPLRQAVTYLSPPADGKPSAAPTGAPAAGSPKGRGPSGALLVITDPATVAVTRDQLKAIGTGDAERSVAVHPGANGIVAEVSFASGDQVTAGQVLATLQNDTEKLALDRARIAAASAERRLARYRQLTASRTVTAVEAEEAQRELDNALLDVRGAEIALADRSIVAPIAGHVGLVGISVGALVDSQSLIATIDDRSRLKIVFFVPEDFVSRIRLGHPVEAVSVGSPGDVYAGRISAIDSRLDEKSRTLRVEAVVDNPADQLRPGMSFILNLTFEGERFLSVDPLSVQWERQGPFVWTVAADEAKKAAIRIIERNVDRVLVVSDALAEGDLVVVEGLQSLREGAKVAAEPREPGVTGGVLADGRETPPDAPPAPASTGAAGGSRASAAEGGAVAGREARPAEPAAFSPAEAAALVEEPSSRGAPPVPTSRSSVTGG